MWAKTPAPRFYPDTPNMTKPASLQPLEELFDLDFVLDETNDPAIFGRYGRRVVDACRYWMRDGVVAGLCARASGITSTNWLNKPEWANLEVLLLGENNFTDLVIPAGMTKLQHLDLNASPELTSVRFAGSPPRLRRLEATDCPKLSTFVVPTDCPDLHYFDLNGCALTSFTLDGDFRSLVYLDLTKSPKLQAFSLAGNFASLLSLHLRTAAQLTKVSLTASLPALDTLDLHGTNVATLPENVILSSPLYRLYAHGCAPENCPAAFLEADGNVLDNVRSWFQALQAGSEKNRIVKLLINGNGYVGKSTLWCALKNKKESACTCADHKTTHGIDLTVEVLALDDVDFRGWDFGGQEIYQGTHRLFLTDGAVQVLVLDYVSEQAAISRKRVSDRSKAGGSASEQLVRNFPLEHFYARQKALGPRSKFLVVQTKRGDGHKHHSAALKLAEEENIKYEFLDAKTTNGVRSLRRDLEDLAKELPIYGMLFPSSWLKVRQWLAGVLKANDTAVEPLRVIDRTNFRTKVVKDFGIADDDQMIEALLIFLHAAGDVYVNKEHLKDKIIIDLSWALEGIYRPLQRNDFQRDARDANGRLHIDKIYPDTTISERNLFLEFMQSCGMCFPADREIERQTASEYYIFPAFLREQPLNRVQSLWKALPRVPSWRTSLPYRDLPAIHALICDLGRKTTEGDLWHSGISLFLNDTRELEPGRELLPDANCKIELADAQEGEQGGYLVVTLDSPEAAAWLPSIQEWVSAHFSDLKWQANEAARTQVQEEVVKSRGGETFDKDDLQDKMGSKDRPVLFFYAVPPGKVDINCKQELDDLRKVGDTYLDRPFFHFKGQEKTSFRTLRSALTVDRWKPRIVHFSGHGDGRDTESTNRGLVVYQNDGTSSRILDARQLGALFKEVKNYHNTQLEVVVLNACMSKEQAIAISEAGLYVVGSTIEIDDLAAIEFSLAFYIACAGTGELDEACLKRAMNKSVPAGNEFYLSRAEDVYQLYYDGKVIPFRDFI
jgi:hypothetical protein